jgi:hypothetical protein
MLEPKEYSMQAGETAYFHVTIIYSDAHWSGTPIDLRVDVPTGMHYSISPTGELSITSPQDALPGERYFDVFGTAQGIERGVEGSIIIEEGSSAEPHETVATERSQVEQTTSLASMTEVEGTRSEAAASSLGAFLSNPLYLIIGILAAALIVVSVALMRRGRAPTTQKGQPRAGYCANCGAALKPGKGFCSQCGEKAE